MNLELYLQANNLWYKFIDKPETIHTADAAAAAEIELNSITKSLVLLDEKHRPLLAIIPGDSRLDYTKIKNVLGSKKIRLVPFNEAEQFSGYPPGATPMVCHKIPMPTVLDQKLTRFESIFGGGGERTKLLELKTLDVIRLNNATIADITE